MIFSVRGRQRFEEAACKSSTKIESKELHANCIVWFGFSRFVREIIEKRC